MAFKPIAEWSATGADLTWWPQKPTLSQFPLHLRRIQFQPDRRARPHGAEADPVVAAVGRVRHADRHERGHGRGLWPVALRLGPEPAAGADPAPPVSADGGDDPGDDHVGLPQPDRHLVGPGADLRHRHAALRLLADEDLLRRHAARDRGGGAGRRLLALARLHPHHAADDARAARLAPRFSSSSSTGRTI